MSPLHDPPMHATPHPPVHDNRVSPPLANTFVDSLGYAIIKRLLSETECEPIWAKMKNNFDKAKEKVVKHFAPIFHVQRAEVQLRSPQVPKRWQSKPTTSTAMEAVPKRLVDKEPGKIGGFAHPHHMTAGPSIVSMDTVDELHHIDTSHDPYVMVRFLNGICHFFVVLSPDYCMAVEAGSANT